MLHPCAKCIIERNRPPRPHVDHPRGTRADLSRWRHACEFEIASRYSLGMSTEIVAYGQDDSIFTLILNGLIGDEDFIPITRNNSVQTPELPPM